MIASEVFEAALARTAEFNVSVPSTQSVALHRINARQQQLFSRIADVSPEYFGLQEVMTLVNNEVDLSLLAVPYERVTFVQIADPGSASYQTADEVNIVPVMDRIAALAPRMFLRDAVLRGVDQDMAGVVSIEVFYSRRATAVTAPTTTIDLPAQFQELLVIDLSRHLLRKTIELTGDARKIVLGSLDEEENEMLADLDRHLEHWRHVETARGVPSARAQMRPQR